jgi:hypothetical protein
MSSTDNDVPRTLLDSPVRIEDKTLVIRAKSADVLAAFAVVGELSREKRREDPAHVHALVFGNKWDCPVILRRVPLRTMHGCERSFVGIEVHASFLVQESQIMSALENEVRPEILAVGERLLRLVLAIQRLLISLSR